MIKLNKIILSIFLVLALISTNFAVGIYEKSDEFEGGYKDIITQFTNLSSPKIDLNVTAFKTPLSVDSAILFFDGEFWNFKLDEKSINSEESKRFVFDLSTIKLEGVDFDLKDYSNVRFKLSVSSGGREVRPLGDETEFYLKYENQPVVLDSFSYEDGAVDLLFDGDVSRVVISLNGKSFVYNNIDSDVRLKKESGENVNIGIASIVDSEDEDLHFEIEYFDLVGRSVVENRVVQKPIEPFSMELMTRSKGYSELKYDYNLNEGFEELFNGTIYSTSSEPTIKVKTNKKATCYKLESAADIDFNTELNFDDALTKLTSNNGMIHSINVEAVGSNLWIACQNDNDKEDVIYLQEVLGLKKLPSLRQYRKDAITILTEYPKGTITENPYNVKLTTNEKAVCFYQLENENKKKLNSVDFLSHVSLPKDKKGTYDINYICYDRVYNIKRVKNTITVDPSLGFLAELISPRMTNKPSIEVRIRLGNSNMDCKQTTGSKEDFVSKFSTYANVTKDLKDESVVYFTLNNMILEKENPFYLFCQDKKTSRISSKKFSVVYTMGNINLSNFSYVNSGNRLHPKYASSQDTIKFQFKADSSLDLSGYAFVNFKKGDPENFTISNVEVGDFTQVSIKRKKGNFSDARSLRLKIFNELNYKENSFNIEFDLEPPRVLMKKVSGGYLLSCTDRSGCEKILYGFGQKQSSCKPSMVYDNSTIKIGENNYFCVNAIDNVGVRSNTKYEKLKSTVVDVPEENVIEEKPVVPEDKVVEEEEVEEEYTNVPPVIKNPTEKPEKEKDTTVYVVASALALILAGIGGGGYYAYKKGYLDKELEKLGILKRKEVGGELYTPVVKKQVPVSNNLGNVKLKNNLQSENVEESSYDKYINKLNRFMNDKIGKSRGKFDEFGNSNKGKVEGYEDTLVKPKIENAKTGKYDSFYDESSKSKMKFEDLDIENQDSESFEEYYKNKKSKK